MKFGLFYLPTYIPAVRDAHTHLTNIAAQIEYADKIGIDYAWMVEHHFVRHGGLSSANYAFLSYMAGRTKRIRLGTGATVLPLNDPVRVAEQAATLDHLSGGRFDFGVGRGFVRDEFDIFDIDMATSRERLEEGVGLIKDMWSGQPVEIRSKFRPGLAGLPVLPPAYQKPHPPIWVACFVSPESFEWTAQHGYNLLYVAYHVDHPVAAERIGWYTNALKKFGKDPAKHEVACAYHVFFQEKSDDARLRALVDKPMTEYAQAGVEATRKPPDPTAYKAYQQREDAQKRMGFDSFYPNRVVMGGPDQAIERLRELKRAGITQVAMLVDYGSLPQAEIMQSLEIFGRKILPRVRELEAAGKF